MSNELRKRMEGALASLNTLLGGLRTGRASVGLLDGVRVEAYGNLVPLKQVSTVNAPDPRLLTVQVWDSALTNTIVKAILEAGLGLNPIAESQLIRIPIPDLSGERRKELSKKASEYAENSKVAVRNIRRDGNDEVKKLEKDKEISEDEAKKRIAEIQKLTDEFIKKIDQATEAKQKEITQV